MKLSYQIFYGSMNLLSRMKFYTYHCLNNHKTLYKVWNCKIKCLYVRLNEHYYVYLCLQFEKTNILRQYNLLK